LSAEYDFIEPLLKAMGDLFAWLRAAGIPVVVIGGVAASLQSKPRLTRDVDAVVLLGDSSMEDLVSAGSRFGIFPRIPDVLRFAQRNRILLLIHEPSSVELDVSLGIMPFEEEMIARAGLVVVKGLSIPLASPEDLVIMKSLAMRDVDARDIDSLLGTHPRLDKARIRHWVRQFAEVMEMPEIVDRLELHLAPPKRIPLMRKSTRSKPRSKRRP
jgi:hypothetical protein